MMRNRKTHAALVLLLGLLLGFGLSMALVLTLRPAGPSCPQEDSCSVQYYNHAWHISATDH